jgi:hypothetical protein
VFSIDFTLLYSSGISSLIDLRLDNPKKSKPFFFKWSANPKLVKKDPV